jgi:hypothetical protein
MDLPSRFAAVVLAFAPVFRQQRTWRRAERLLIGAVLAPGKRTVTSLLRIVGLNRERRFVNYHRVLSRAVWNARAASHLLLELLIAAFVPVGPVVLGIDDTIERRRGRRISAKGIYRDPVRSSKGHFVKASGLRWLSLMLLAPIPWAGRVWALPFLTALAPSERCCRARGRRPKKLTDRARRMGLQARRWPPGREVVLLGDTSFAALDLLAALARQGLVCITRLRLDAALYEPAPPRQPGTVGRPRTKGARLPKLAAVLVDEDTRWVRVVVPGPAGTARASGPSRSAPPPPSGATPGCRSCQSAGCCCATLSAGSTRRRCCAPIQGATRCRSCAGSSSVGRWRSPSGRPGIISASRRSGGGRIGRSPVPRRACSRCSRS